MKAKHQFGGKSDPKIKNSVHAMEKLQRDRYVDPSTGSTKIVGPA